MNITRFTSIILLAACITLTGCTFEFYHEAISSHTNPIATGWQLDFAPETKAIETDCQNFIQKLPPKERPYAGWGNYYKDGTGQHAVEIRVALDGTCWNYVLIYDKDNKRAKVYKYVGGHYSC